MYHCTCVLDSSRVPSAHSSPKTSALSVIHASYGSLFPITLHKFTITVMIHKRGSDSFKKYHGMISSLYPVSLGSGFNTHYIQLPSETLQRSTCQLFIPSLRESNSLKNIDSTFIKTSTWWFGRNYIDFPPPHGHTLLYTWERFGINKTRAKCRLLTTTEQVCSLWVAWVAPKASVRVGDHSIEPRTEMLSCIDYHILHDSDVRHRTTCAACMPPCSNIASRKWPWLGRWAFPVSGPLQIPGWRHFSHDEGCAIEPFRKDRDYFSSSAVLEIVGAVVADEIVAV